MSTKTCPICNKTFETENKMKIYCSNKCAKKAWRIHGKKEPRIRKCPNCGKYFIDRRGLKQYCSDKCRDAQKRIREKAARQPLKKLCVICGKYFNAWHPQQKTCSKECRKIHRTKRGTEYTIHWRYKHRALCKKLSKKYSAIRRLKYPNETAKYQREYYQERIEEMRLKHKIYEQNKRIATRLESGKIYCQICGKIFNPQYAGQKYCSDECRNDPKAKALRKFFTQFFADGYLEESANDEGDSDDDI